MRTDSDIDIFVVRPDELEHVEVVEAWQRDLDRLQRGVTVWTGNDTRVLEMSEFQVRNGLSTQDEVLLALRREGVTLHGSNNYWRRMSRE